MTEVQNSLAGRSGARVGREVLRDDQLLNPHRGAMECDRERHSLLDEPAGDPISNFHLATSIAFCGQSAEEMPGGEFCSHSTCGDA